MKKAHALASLSRLFDSWEDDEYFFFYKKLLIETRSKSNVERDSGVALTNSKSNILNLSKKLVEIVRSIFGLIVLLWRSLVTPKGLPVIFNHSDRQRKTINGKRPLYLGSWLGQERLVVFEDAAINFGYDGLVQQFQSCYVTRSSQIISWGLIRFYGRKKLEDRDIASFVVARVLWRLIFWLLRPSCIRLFVWYGKDAVVGAAKSMEIDIADVQHGVVYKSHPFYNLNSIPWPKAREYLLPDQCFVYGEYWRSLLIRAGWSPEKVKVVGYFLDTLPGKSSFTDKRYILYTSQPDRSELIISHIKSIYSELEKRDVRVLIALHPAETRGCYDELLNDVVQVSEDWDSYDQLRCCYVHISVSSTLLWEAVIFDKSSYVLDYGRDAVDLLSDFISVGFGRCISDGQFPEPFTLPASQSKEYFFSTALNTKLLLNSKN